MLQGMTASFGAPSTEPLSDLGDGFGAYTPDETPLPNQDPEPDDNIVEPPSFYTQGVMTDWVNEPGINDLQNDVQMTLNQRSYHHGRICMWRDMYHCRGKYSGQNGDYDHDTKHSTVQPKLIAQQAEWRIAMLSEPFLSTDDMFDVNPSKKGSIASALQQTTVLNYQWRNQIDRINLVNRLVRVLCIDGTAVMKVSWDSQEVEEEVEVPRYQTIVNLPEARQQVLLNQVQGLLQAKQMNQALYEANTSEALKLMVEIYEASGQIAEVVKIGTEKKTEVRIVRNTPLVELCPAENFFVDPSCAGDIEKAQFVARTFATCRGWLEASSVNYQNLDDVSWSSGNVHADPYYADSTDPSYDANDETRHQCVATEYWGKWDIHGDGTLVPIVATWIGDTLIRLEENPFPDGKPPFVFISYTPEPYSIYGVPDAELTIDNQRIIGALTRGYVDMMAKSAAGQRGVSKEALDTLNFDRFQRGEDYLFNPGTNMATAVYMHDFASVNPSALQMLQRQQMEAEALSGVRPFQGSVDSPNPTSVIQSGLGALDAAAIREADIMKRIARGFVSMGKKIISMNALFLEPDDVEKVTGESYVPPSVEDIRGSFDLSINVQTQAQNSAKAKGLMFVLQTCGPNLDTSMQQLLLGQICRLQGLTAVAQSIETFQPKPNPEQAAEMQSKLAVQQAQAQKLAASATKSQADAQHKQMQTQQLYLGTKSQDQGASDILKSMLKGGKPDEKEPDISNAISFLQAASQQRIQDQQRLNQIQQLQQEQMNQANQQQQEQSDGQQ